jgi:hypothetical protein
MRLLDWDKVVANPYNHLLVAEIIVLVGSPILSPIRMRFPIMSLLFLLAIIPSLHVGLPRRAFFSLISLALLGFTLHVLAQFDVLPESDNVRLAMWALFAVFFLISIVVLIGRIASRRIVTADTIKGGLSVYFLIGIFFNLVYLIILQVDPLAFANVKNAGSDCFYFSFVTLTTLGYGDIVPVSAYAKSLAILEAFIGQTYLAVFIAQLVGMRLAERMEARREPRTPDTPQ